MTSKVNIILGLVVSTLLLINIPLHAYAGTVSGGDFENVILSESIYDYDIMTMSESEVLSIAETSTADFTYRNLNGNASIPLYLDNYTFTEDGGSVVATYSGDLTIPIMVYNNGTTGILRGELLRRYDCVVSSQITGASVEMYSPSVIDCSIPDETYIRFSHLVTAGYDTSFEFGLAFNHLLLSSAYSGYITLRFNAVVTSDSTDFFGSSYKYVIAYVKEASDFFGSYAYVPNPYPSDGSVERIQTELLNNINQYTQPLAGHLSDIKTKLTNLTSNLFSWFADLGDRIISMRDTLSTNILHFHTDLVANMQAWFTDIMCNIDAFNDDVNHKFESLFDSLEVKFSLLFEKLDSEHEEIINGYDSTTNNDSLSEVETTVNTATEQQDAINNDAFGYVDSYTIPSDGIGSYATQFLTVFPLVSSMMQSIFDSSGAFGIIFSVIFTMSIVCMVIGMFRFYKS